MCAEPDRTYCRYVPIGSGAYLSRHRFEEGGVASEPSFESSVAPAMEVDFQRGVSGRFHRTRQRTLNTRRQSPASQSDREAGSSIPYVRETTRSPSGVVIDARSPIASLGPTVRRIPPGLHTEPVIRSGAVIVTRGRGRRIAREIPTVPPLRRHERARTSLAEFGCHMPRNIEPS